MGITFLTGLDTRERTADRFGVPGRPHLVLIGADGKVAWRGHPADEDFREAVDAALTKLPVTPRFSSDDLPRDVQRHADAAEDGKLDRAIKGLQKIIDDDDADEDSLAAAKKLMDEIRQLAERCFQEIKQLEESRLYYDADERADEYDWLQELADYSDKLSELQSTWGDAAHRTGKRAGERYHRGLESLRKGEVSRARKDFEYVAEKFEETAYAELARKMLESTR